MSLTKTRTRKSRSQKTAISDPSPSVPTTEYAVGDDIAHPQFGDGTVTDTDGDKLTIKFADGRVKQILDSYVKRRRP
jgi:hypothetical protein